MSNNKDSTSNNIGASSQTLQQTFGPRSDSETMNTAAGMQQSPKKSNKAIENKTKASLPPGVEGDSLGSLFVEAGQMEWFTYDGINYLAESGGEFKPIQNLFLNIKFWGDSTKGTYLRCQNGMRKGEKVTNRFRYDVLCPERTFEKYLDDMGVLVVDFFDTTLNQTVGTSKIMMKLYIKRAKREDDDGPLLELRGSFPITLTGNTKVTIGQFNLSLISSYSVASTGKKELPTMHNELLDSFMQNERKAQQIAGNRAIHDKIFQDERVPSSYQGKKENEEYKSTNFAQNDFDERPTRQRPASNNSNKPGFIGKDRKTINIDENEDTYHNQEQLQRIIARGQKLRDQMDQALDGDAAWEALHGPHHAPKKYVPPFQGRSEEEDGMNRIYELEIDGYDPRQTKKEDQRAQQQAEENFAQNGLPNSTGHISEMKFIKVKIVKVNIENEELLHQMIEHPFTMVVDMPLPDIYQTKIAFQQLKLNNYEIESFSEFSFNNSSLYNFKVDEETFNKLVGANLKVSLEGLQVTGSMSMIKLLMAKGYKLETTLNLEKTVKFNEEASVSTIAAPAKKGGPKGKEPPKKPGQKDVPTPTSRQAGQSYTSKVGSVTIEMQLQRGDTDVEIAREYHIKLQQLKEQKDKEDKERAAEQLRYSKFTHREDPMFASLYVNIAQIKNICLNTDGTIIQPEQNEEGIENNNLHMKEEGKMENDAQSMSSDATNKPNIPKRNLFVQYKAFPGLEKLKTNIAWHESEPKFQYRSQFPVIVNPDTLEKLQNFTFILEVWDHIQPSREEFIGLVKIPLSSFCYSMKTSDEQIFSLNFLADQHCLYPMIISDGALPIYSPRHGLDVGEIYLTLALGTTIQINRQIQKEQDIERQQMDLETKNKIARAKAQKTQTIIMPAPVLPDTPPKKIEEPVPEVVLPSALLKSNPLFKGLGTFFKQSVNTSRDFDVRKLTHLNCLRKLFEEARASDLQELNGQSELFREMPKNFDGTLKKDDFIYAILNMKSFSLTRTEISNMASLLVISQPNVNKSASESIDLEDLQKSYRAYQTYYDSVERTIKDLLEKIMLSVQKKIDNNDEYEDFVKQIEDKANESKINVGDLRDIFDNNGVFIRDGLYDQLSSYFDLDRNDQIYITSFIDYLRNPGMNSFNFFKVHPVIVVNLVSTYIKNEIQLRSETLSLIEDDLKKEFYSKQTGTQESFPEGEVSFKQPPIIAEDILIQERINAKLFQGIIRKYGVQLSFWELFTLFDHLNTTYDKMYYEPQRYHQVTFGSFFRFITNTDYDAKVKEDTTKRQLREEELRKQLEAEEAAAFLLQQQQMMLENPLLHESAIDLAEDLNKDLKSKGEGIYSSKSYDQNSEEDMESVDINTPKSSKRNHHHHLEKDPRPFHKVKHVFEIQVKELKNIPLLDKLIKDLSSVEQSKLQYTKQQTNKKDKSSRYIQSVAVKYSFPLDEEELFQSDFLQLNSDVLQEHNQYDYKVSINTVHNYMMNKEDSIAKLLNTSNGNGGQSLFNIQLVIYDMNKEYVIGNAQLPIEDLVEVVDNYRAQMKEGYAAPGKQSLQRVLFIYGTTYSQRENCIIGKMQIDIGYNIEKQYSAGVQAEPKEGGVLSENAPIVPPLSNLEHHESNNTCFLHRETFIKRKIPLNAVLSIEIERINNLKESLENLEHFAKIQQSAMNKSDLPQNSKLSAISASYGTKNTGVIHAREQTDRRRILTQIFKQGLNLQVIASLFDEDSDLKKKFPISKHTCRLLFNTLTPIFNEGFEIPIQMDTNIFEYLKNKKAVFEVRHYIMGDNKQSTSMARNKSESSISQVSSNTEENEERDLTAECDFIVIGIVKVPLLHLITKNNGIDGDFVIFDDYKQQMGSLKLRIGLNHHSNKRPLYSETNKLPTSTGLNTDVHNVFEQKGTMIDRTVKLTQTFMRSSMGGAQILTNTQQYLLGLNFVELVMKSQNMLPADQSFMYLKFRLLGQSFQTKFISNQIQGANSDYLKSLNLSVIDIKKTVFIELDFLKQTEIEEAFARPLEVQLWQKREHAQRYHQPESEQQLGSFFIELNDLGKVKNRRIKDQNGILQCYEGYFSLFDYQREQVVTDRLGCKVMMIKKDYDAQLSDLEVLFNNLQPLERILSQQLDPQFKGFADFDDLQAAVQTTVQEPYQSLLKSYVSTLEYKNSDKVFYSPLLGAIPPYFRYLKRFDSFGVIEKFSKELQSIDTHSTGFVPVNLFRSILEHELKIKEKIVLDFIQSLRETDHTQQLQSLDVNLFSHSLRSHIDYVTLLRKLALYFENKATGAEVTQVSEAGDTIDEGEILLKVDIESAIRLRNPINDLEPPNAFVSLSVPYEGAQPHKIQTHTINKSSYPAWHQVNQQIKVNFTNHVMRHMIDFPLEFEVHHQLPANQREGASVPIGVAYVDLSQMIFVDGVYQVTGYFHIVKRERFADGQTVPFVNPHRMSLESLGQLKLTVTSNVNLKQAVNANPLTRSIAREHSPMDNTRMMPSPQPEQQRRTTSTIMSPQPVVCDSLTQKKFEYSFNRAGLDLENKPQSELKSSLQAQMNGLDELNRSMLSKFNRDGTPSPDRFIGHRDMAMTMGHQQSAEMRSSFQPFAYQPRVGGAYRQQQVIPEIYGGQYNDDEDEEDDRIPGKDESFHRENVFDNNISQRSFEEDNQIPKEQYYSTFNQQHQQNEDPTATLMGTNVFLEVQPNNQFRLSRTLDEQQHQEEEDLSGGPLGGISAIYEPGDAGRRAESVPMVEQNDMMINDNDDEERELRRIEKILKSKKDE